MSESTRTAARGAAFWICYAVTVISAGVSVTFSVLAVVDGGLEATDALYAASRSTALVVLALVAPLFRSDDALLAIAAAMTIVQGIDTFVGAVQGDVAKTVGPAVLCLVTIVAATFLARSDRVRGRA
ncbi:hypothetical protein EDM22_03415 [Agromyces tardus]|jgi:hypothetical protein|uniref:Uncharacterized protein n=1 Tax=Agromyces tardus TaxID=2583849 RepID=A0A3M8AJW4_9MICO|nr:hypothetical protein [Agromyces tardus]RNB51500.1 hypothetical protein EDM22_03415 [Agromyces tardus]